MRKIRSTEHQNIAVLKQSKLAELSKMCDAGPPSPTPRFTSLNYLRLASTESDFGFWVVAYIYPASAIPVPRWVIRTPSPQQLDGLEGQYKNQVPIVQVQPVTLFQYSATFEVSSFHCWSIFCLVTKN